MAYHRVISIGYQRRSIDELIAMLKEHSVKKVIDVREMPTSRRVDFRKNVLRSHLAAAGIQYQHIKDAGNPYRKVEGDFEYCMSLYSSYLANHPTVIEQISAAISEEAVAIFCYEREHEQCHRSILIEKLTTTMPDIDLVKVE